MRSKRKPPVLAIESNGTDLFIVVDGVKIAKRGHPDSPQAKTWITLEPGWQVSDDLMGGLVIECDVGDVPIH